jgi:anaerobic ribonucleoside-triphosphate reductase activating protein
MTSSISLSRIHFPVTALGPGRRLGIWFQGCSIRCPGCISGDTWRFSESSIKPQDIVSQLDGWLQQCDGVTVSGGEPFDQPVALVELLQRIRAAKATNVLLYSGYPIERIAPVLRQVEGLVDALISDPYLVTEPQQKPLRGSDNQRLHLLTPLGVELFGRYAQADLGCAPQLDLMLDEDGTAWLAGIPRRGDLPRLQAILALQGHKAQTTQVPGAS